MYSLGQRFVAIVYQCALAEFKFGGGLCAF